MHFLSFGAATASGSNIQSCSAAFYSDIHYAEHINLDASSLAESSPPHVEQAATNVLHPKPLYCPWLDDKLLLSQRIQQLVICALKPILAHLSTYPNRIPILIVFPEQAASISTLKSIFSQLEVAITHLASTHEISVQIHFMFGHHTGFFDAMRLAQQRILANPHCELCILGGINFIHKEITPHNPFSEYLEEYLLAKSEAASFAAISISKNHEQLRSFKAIHIGGLHVSTPPTKDPNLTKTTDSIQVLHDTLRAMRQTLSGPISECFINETGCVKQIERWVNATLCPELSDLVAIERHAPMINFGDLGPAWGAFACGLAFHALHSGLSIDRNVAIVTVGPKTCICLHFSAPLMTCWPAEILKLQHRSKNLLERDLINLTPSEES